MAFELEVFSDASERLHYNMPDFPLYVRRGNLKDFRSHRAASHWHADVEFLLVTDGGLTYDVNGCPVEIHCGECIFVNSRRLHHGYSTDGRDCNYLVVAVHPSLLGGGEASVQAEVDGLFGRQREDHLVLRPGVPWQEECMHRIWELEMEMQSDTPRRLHLLFLTLGLCDQVSAHLRSSEGAVSDDASLEAVRRMEIFIEERHTEKISVAQIATAGAVCRSRCCSLFALHRHLSPMQAVLRVRMLHSRRMLEETHRTVAEIALSCGFHSPSHFTQVFRSVMGQTPQAYRKAFSPLASNAAAGG